MTGLLATALAFTVQAWAQQHTTPTRTALIYSLEPVVAWLTSFWLMGEVLSRRAALGAGTDSLRNLYRRAETYSFHRTSIHRSANSEV